MVDLRIARAVDHTVMTLLENIKLARKKRGSEPLVIVGLDGYRGNSLHPHAARYTKLTSTTTS